MPRGVKWTEAELALIREAIPKRTRSAVKELVVNIQTLMPTRSVASIKDKLKRMARESDYVDAWMQGRVMDKWRMNILEHGPTNVDPRSVLAQVNMKGIVKQFRRLSPRLFVLCSVKEGFLLEGFDWYDIVPKSKTCCTCKIPKIRSDFGYSKTSLDGLKATCKRCWANTIKNLRKNSKKPECITT